MKIYSQYVKRSIDIVFSSILLILLFPIFLCIIIVLIIKKSPVIFAQRRPGYKNKPFVMYKFCTMTNETNNDGNLLRDAERIHPFGKFLRSTSLDELPELWNVLKGDMSLIGPRPLLMEYISLYNEQQIRRHDVKPGITGWAQVNGRNNLNWEDKFKLDVWYVDNRSLLLDFKILCMTFFTVAKREGISHEGQVTMEKFKGNNK